MGIGSSIWHSCVATFQPNWFQLYSSTFFLRKIFCSLSLTI